ncbi:AraC family transcriptional regulator [Nitratireductor sp. XY-223]|uniref:helix-turn-helix transcriptional regulator n=1 Tax=Nitratireductor sp. XY-223 TaxID=2561926 RepID=UPI0010AB1F4B|nr:AraC family transcriptional regulator [Nitratireductor sp. XY-223]
MVQGNAVTSVELDTTVLPAEDQFAFWRESKAELTGVEFTRDEPFKDPFHLKRQSLQTEKLVLDRFAVRSASKASTTEKSLGRAELNLIQFIYQVSGGNEAAAFGGDTRTMKDHDIRAIDLLRPFSTENSGCDGYTLVLNRTQLLSELPPGADLHGLILDNNPICNMLKDLLPVFFRELKRAGSGEVSILTDSLTRLVIDAIRLQEIKDLSSVEISFQSKKAAVRQYIEQHYLDRDLTAERIAAELGMSRSTLYRACGIHETPRRLIQDIRLSKAAGALRSSRGRNIGKLAYDLGFSCRQVFARSFHREFGMSPGEYRNEARVRHRQPAPFDCGADVWSHYHTYFLSLCRP